MRTIVARFPLLQKNGEAGEMVIDLRPRRNAAGRRERFQNEHPDRQGAWVAENSSGTYSF
jgi:hypothetical protein